MIRRAAPLAFVLAALSGCGRPAADQPVPGAEGVTRAETATRATEDIRAALLAARGPAPNIAPPERARPAGAGAEDAPAPPAAPEETGDLLSDLPANDTAAR